MKYRTRIVARAQRDVEECYQWIAGHSVAAAIRWHAAFEAAIKRLETAPLSYAFAKESRSARAPIRAILFRSNPRRSYYIVYLVRGTEVDILRVRGPGQPPLTRDELDIE